MRNIRSSAPAQIPAMPPKIDELIDKVDDKLSMGGARSRAIKIMDLAMTELETRIPDVNRPEKLAQIVRDMNHVVHTESGVKSNDNRIGQIVIYAPRMVREDIFDVVGSVE